MRMWPRKSNRHCGEWGILYEESNRVLSYLHRGSLYLVEARGVCRLCVCRDLDWLGFEAVEVI